MIKMFSRLATRALAALFCFALASCQPGQDVRSPTATDSTTHEVKGAESRDENEGNDDRDDDDQGDDGGGDDDENEDGDGDENEEGDDDDGNGDPATTPTPSPTPTPTPTPTPIDSYQQLTFEAEEEHTEPDVRVNPNDPDHVLVSWMQRPRNADLNDCAMAVTMDGGRSWSYHVFPKVGHPACADISFAFAPPEVGNGTTVYANYLAYGAPGGVGDADGVSTYEPEEGLVGQIYVVRSDDGGKTWQHPVVVFEGADHRAPAAFDRPWIAVDNSQGFSRGRIYISSMTVFVQQLTPRVYLRYSDDGGQTFAPPIEVDKTLRDAARSTPFATLAVGPDGRVIMVYRSWPVGVADDQPDSDANLADQLHEAGVPEHDNGALRASERSGEGYCIACFTAASIAFKPSSKGVDPGADFNLMPEAERPYTITHRGLPFINRSDAPRNSEESATYAVIAADPTTPGRFAAVFGDPRYSREAQSDDFNHLPPGHSRSTQGLYDYDISFSWTDDGGLNWSRPIRVNDDPIGNGVIQDRQWLNFDAQTGLPVVVWRDRRHALGTEGTGNGVMSDLYAARLTRFGQRDWGDAPQSVDQPSSVNSRRYAVAPQFSANQRLSSPIVGQHGGGFTPSSSLSDSFFAVSAAPPHPPSTAGSQQGPGFVWAVWAPILVSVGNNTQRGVRQIMLRIWDPASAVDLAPHAPEDRVSAP